MQNRCRCEEFGGQTKTAEGAEFLSAAVIYSIISAPQKLQIEDKKSPYSGVRAIIQKKRAENVLFETCVRVSIFK